jgi:hypothetical protein
MTARAEHRRRMLTRLLAGLGVGTGLALLARPQRIADAVAPAFPRERLWLVRLLGVRLVVQHGAVLTAPTAGWVRLGSAVDLAHAATMVPFVASPRFGRAARISGGLAAAYAAVALALAPRGRWTPRGR